jgi:hypothetical protein
MLSSTVPGTTSTSTQADSTSACPLGGRICRPPTLRWKSSVSEL